MTVQVESTTQTVRSGFLDPTAISATGSGKPMAYRPGNCNDNRDVSIATTIAVGRSIWEGPLRELIAANCSRDDVVDAVAGTYRELIDTYTRAHRGA